ncbi:MAG: hypothetical protein ACRECY_16620, partial [Phyllobacterium sp.]
PYKNKDFWDIDKDPLVLRDFIMRYVNSNNRQSSPKYLYGESYSGIRTPILANRMEEAGTAQFEPDPTGLPPVVLSGFVLNSPILDYGSNCGMLGPYRCNGFIPSYAIMADYYGLTKTRGTVSLADYAEAMRKFIDEKYEPAIQAKLKGQTSWDAYRQTAEGVQTLADLAANTGDLAQIITQTTTTGGGGRGGAGTITTTKLTWTQWWEAGVSRNPMVYLDTVRPRYAYANYNIYDARMSTTNTAIDPSAYYDAAFPAGLQEQLTQDFDYHNGSHYSVAADQNQSGNLFSSWNYTRANSAYRPRSSLTDLTNALTYDPALKTLVVHGYTDFATPFHQTDLDLKGIGLQDRVPVKLYEGGHMMYFTQPSRQPLKSDLDAFYDAPPYGSPPPPVVATQ